MNRRIATFRFSKVLHKVTRYNWKTIVFTIAAWQPAIRTLDEPESTGWPRLKFWITPLPSLIGLAPHESFQPARLLDGPTCGMRYGSGRLIGPAVMLSGRSSVKEVRGQELDGTRGAFQRWTGEQMESRRVRLRRWTASPSQTLQNKDLKKKKTREHRVYFKVRFFLFFLNYKNENTFNILRLFVPQRACRQKLNPNRCESRRKKKKNISVAFSWK